MIGRKLFLALAGACACALSQADPKVKLGGVLGERFELTIKGNFLKLDLEKDFFKPFLERKSKDGFIGLGKLADSAVHLAKNSGDNDVIARKKEIVDFIIKNQLPDGYTGFFAPEARMKRLWDIHEMGFILQSLVSDWELFGNRAALEAAKKNVDYVIANWKLMPENWEQIYITDRETTLGYGYGLARLYAVTRDPKLLKFLKVERALEEWNDPIVIGRDKMIYGQAYAYLGTCLEQIELYKWEPKELYLETSRRALEFMTRGDGLLINGSGGIAECWTDDQDGEGSVGETCMVAFVLLFYDELIRLGIGDPAQLGDLMERAIYNALFAAQSADGRRLRYYTPLNGERKYFNTDTFCCPGNFRRAIGRLPEYVFYTKGASVLANLYTACTAELDVDGTKVKLTEETAYPKDGKVKFTFEPDEAKCFSFKVRVPKWCREPSVKINGLEVVYKYAPGEILNLPRVWKQGDTVELSLPMAPRAVLGRKRQSGRFAVMVGPVVYALDTRKTHGIEKSHPLDAATVMMVDPTRLTYADGVVKAFASTSEFAVGVGDGAPEVTLIPFADPDNTLTYFRAPDIKNKVVVGDELFMR